MSATEQERNKDSLRFYNENLNKKHELAQFLNKYNISDQTETYIDTKLKIAMFFLEEKLRKVGLLKDSF